MTTPRDPTLDELFGIGTTVPRHIILDTQVVLHLRNGTYQDSYAELLARFTDAGVMPVVPRLVEVEALQDANSLEQFDRAWTFIKDNFPIWPITDSILRGGCFLHTLYRRHPQLEKYTRSKKRLVNDLIIACFAVDYSLKQHADYPKVAYILSEDRRAYHPPYFTRINTYEIKHAEGGQSHRASLWFCSGRKILKEDMRDAKHRRARREKGAA